MAQASESHECPRKGCHARVPNTQFCCSKDWWQLRPYTRSLIRQTASKTVLDKGRRRAIAMAGEDWA
jgi:hypothetical protein